QGWPLYAAINIAGAPLPTIHTDPVTGAYSVSLPQGASVTLNVSVDGYVYQARGITVPAAPATEDFAMLVDQASCNAPGYAYSGLAEHFDGTFPPAGWTVVDDAGNGVVWTNVTGSGESGNFTGGTGDAASVSSDVAGSVEFDTSLVSPVIPASNAILRYLANYQNLSNLDFLDLDISIDGGAWTNVLSWNEDHGGFRATPGEEVNVDLTAMLAGATNYQLRWHYYDPNTGDWDWYAQIDDVTTGACAPDAAVGGLLVGNVYDANVTGAPVNGATVSHGAHQTTSAATPDDAALDDGFYILAVPADMAISVDATASGYGTDSKSVTVPGGGALRQDFELPAGLLSATPASLSMTLWEGMTWTTSLDLVNNGGAAAAYELQEFDAPYNAPQANGPWADKVRHASPKHLDDRDASLLRYVPAPVHKGTAALPNPNAAGDVLSQFVSGLDSPWGIAFNTEADDLWVNNLGAALGGTDDDNHRFLRNGTDTGDAITPTWMAVFVGDGTYDPFNNTLWQVNVGGDNCIYESDPSTLAATGASICPAFGTSMRGLAFDPLTDTFYAGSWNDTTIHHFDRSGTILDSANVGLAIAGLAFNPDTGHLFVLSNVDATGDDMAVLDVNNSYALVASFDTGVPDFTQGGLSMSCDGHLWVVQQPSGNAAGDDAIVEIDSGEPTACAWFGIDWLSENPVTGTVAANSSEPIDFTFDSTALTAGTYTAHVKVINDTPYGSVPVPVVFNVIPYAQMFADVPPTHQFYDWVQSVGFAGITSGCDNQTPLPNYCDTDNVTRGQMAIFLERGMRGSDYTPPPATGTVFADVPASYWAASWVEQLVADGVTSGCGGGNYCPDADITRAQMAIFLLRAKHGASYTPPPATGTVFGDVAAGDFGADWIEQLVSEGITSGCGGGNYCPNDSVTRGQMAVFIQRNFNLPIHP
ncbi:S-layer homology domain-containing protein, partial [Thiolapillus sp.]